MNIVNLFDERAASQPESQALIDMSRGETVVSYSALQGYSTAIANQLAREGLSAGDRVLIALPVSVQLYATLLGIWRLGAVAVFPDPGARGKQLAHCCEKAEAAAFIGSSKAHLLRLLLSPVRRIPRHYAFSLGTQRLKLTGSRNRFPAVEPPAGTAALITFTSGSTGLPKAAARSHDFLIAQYRSVCRTLALKPGQRDVTTLPVFVLANLAAGVTTLLPPGNLRKPGHLDPKPVLRAMQRHHITRASGSPAFFERLMAGITAECHPKLHSLHTGGAPVTPALMQKLDVLTADRNLHAVYGSTEAEPIAELGYRDLTEVQRTGPAQGRGIPAGTPVPEIDLNIVPVDSIQTQYPTKESWWGIGCKTDQPGEIVVAGDHVLPGYLDGVGDDTTKITVAGRRWHRTGDIGYRDQSGCLWLLGRASAMVHINGQPRYPFELEYPAMEHPEVRRAALVNRRDGPLLVIEPFPRTAPKPADIAAKLPFDFPPEWIRVVKRIPTDRRHNAKVDYTALQKLDAVIKG